MPKVIHIVEAMNNQAVENWLLRMLNHAVVSGQKPDWTFYCTVGPQGMRDEAVRRLGARVIYSAYPLANGRTFVQALRDELKRGGYDVLHCHHDIMSAPYLLAAFMLPIRKRIVHVHNADLGLPTRSSLKTLALREPFRRICLAADSVVGISHHALDAMLGARSRVPGRHLVHYYGVDPSPFFRPEERESVRRQLGISIKARILLFGGRIVPEKNPVFAVDVLAALRCYDANAIAVFAGAGSEEQRVLDRARALGVDDAVRLIGWRHDLPQIMSASDWFILPRPEKPMEGFGLAVVEAQLAGLRLLLSRGIANDPLLPTARYRRLGLGEGAEAWAAAAIDVMSEPSPSLPDTFAALQASPMNMDFALADLIQLHQ